MGIAPGGPRRRVPFPRGVERGRAHGLGVGIASTRRAPASCRALRDYCAGSPIRTANSSPWRDPAADVREPRWGRSERAADVSPPASLRQIDRGGTEPADPTDPPRSAEPKQACDHAGSHDDEFVVRIDASRSKKIRKPSKRFEASRRSDRAHGLSRLLPRAVAPRPPDALAAPFFRGVAFARARARGFARASRPPFPPGRGIRA